MPGQKSQVKTSPVRSDEANEEDSDGDRESTGIKSGIVVAYAERFVGIDAGDVWVRLGEQLCPSREHSQRIDPTERTAPGHHYMRVFGNRASPVMMLVG